MFHGWLYPLLFRASLPPFRCSAASGTAHLGQSLCLTQTLQDGEHGELRWRNGSAPGELLKSGRVNMRTELKVLHRAGNSTQALLHYTAVMGAIGFTGLASKKQE